MKNQKEMLETYEQDILNKGRVYSKSGIVYAIKVTEELVGRIDTVLNGELETSNNAQLGDYIVKNNTEDSELYVLESDNFIKRYDLEKSIPDEEGYLIYRAKGKCKAIEYKGSDFFFVAPWSEEMICNTGDYLVMPITGEEIIREIYRIEKNAFFETYN